MAWTRVGAAEVMRMLGISRFAVGQEVGCEHKRGTAVTWCFPSLKSEDGVYGRSRFQGTRAFGSGQVTFEMLSGHPRSGETLQVRVAGRRGVSRDLEGWSYLGIRG